MMNYDEIFLEKYVLAYKKLKDILKKINIEYSNKEDVNPIENMKFRIKKLKSLQEKLMKRNLEFTPENIDNNIRDVVGCRVVCSFKSDIEVIKNEIIKLQDEGILKIVNIKDYIENPKDNGYSSFHMIVSIPVKLSNRKWVSVNTEIQIRTVAMDVTSSLEHKLAYKKNNCSKEIKDTMKNISSFCRLIDNDLDTIVKTHNIKPIESSNNRIKDIDKIKIHYTTALDFILNKIANIYELYEKSDITNPIEHVKGRIKKDNEIIRKLENKKLDINIENIVEHVNDFAGCKIVCSFINDIEVLKEEIKTMEKNGLLKIIKEKDYITNPKESGYRGYHFLVSVPIYLRDVGVINVKVEIQIRTVAMEMWASLEEKICYHKNPDDNIKNELVRTSNVIKVFDEELNDVVLKYNQNKIEAKKKMLV